MADTEEPPADDSDKSPEDDVEAPAPLTGSGPYPQLLHHQLLTPRAPLAPGAAVRVYPMPVHRPSVPAVWAEDPSGRHQWRWWNGWSWTDHVADDGEAAIDPLP